jgi:DNA-binding IclR family transcriptional regulator
LGEREASLMARPRTDPDPDTPKVLDKALRVLDAFGDARDRWSEADLRRHLGMPSSSLNRILRGLERAGYVLRDDAGSYRLGIGAVRLGDRARASLDLPGIVDAELRELAEATRELVLFAVAEPALGAAVYIAAVDSPQRLRVTAELGTRVPLTAGATARSLLAFAPDALIEQVLARPREPLAEGTLLDEAAIRERLARIRANGWGISWQETFDGAWALAAPLLDEEGHPLASIGVAAPISRHSEATEEATRQALLHAVARAGERLRLPAPTEPRPASAPAKLHA